jgi:hypothetical protein
MAGIVFGLGVTAAACHLPRVPEYRRRQHPPVPERRLGDPLFTAGPDAPTRGKGVPGGALGVGHKGEGTPADQPNVGAGYGDPSKPRGPALCRCRLR